MTRTNPCSKGSEAGGRYQTASGAVTVTTNRCEIDRPAPSVAVTRISAAPTANARMTNAVPSTVALATAGSVEDAV